MTTGTIVDPDVVAFETICEPDFESECDHCGRAYTHRTVVPWLFTPDTRGCWGTICPTCMSDDVLMAYIGELQNAAAGKKPEWGWMPSEEDRTAAQEEARALSSYLPEIKAIHIARPNTWRPCVVLPDGAIILAFRQDADAQDAGGMADRKPDAKPIEPDADLPDLDPDIWGEVLDL